jgi:hypothetical protein
MNTFVVSTSNEQEHFLKCLEDETALALKKKAV